MAKKRVYTILHTIETSGIGGAENVLVSLASGLDRQRYRAVAVVPEPGRLRDALEARGVPTHVVGSSAWWDLRLPRGLARVCRAEGVDLIHSHLPDQNFYSCMAGKVTGCETVATYHGPVEFQQAGSLRARAKLRFVRSAAAGIVTVSNGMRERLLEMGFPSSRLVHIYNGIDVGAFQSARASGIRDRFGWPPGTRLVGKVANVRLTKGYEYFVRSARRTIDRDPSVRFIGVGDLDPVLSDPILRLIRELGLEEHVKLLGHRDDVPELMQDLDVFVLASTSEGFPLVVLEAMAAGKCVVATRCGGPEEVVHDGVNGYLVEPGDVAALSDRILELLSDGALARSFQERARETAARFDLSSMIGKYERLYQEVLMPRPPAAPSRSPAGSSKDHRNSEASVESQTPLA